MPIAELVRQDQTINVKNLEVPPRVEDVALFEAYKDLSNSVRASIISAYEVAPVLRETHIIGDAYIIPLIFKYGEHKTSVNSQEVDHFKDDFDYLYFLPDSSEMKLLYLKFFDPEKFNEVFEPKSITSLRILNNLVNDIVESSRRKELTMMLKKIVDYYIIFTSSRLNLINIEDLRLFDQIMTQFTDSEIKEILSKNINGKAVLPFFRPLAYLKLLKPQLAEQILNDEKYQEFWSWGKSVLSLSLKGRTYGNALAAGRLAAFMTICAAKEAKITPNGIELSNKPSLSIESTELPVERKF